MDNGEHLSTADDSVDFEVSRVKVDPLVDGFLIVGNVQQALIVSLVEAVDLVLHVLSESQHLLF